jgi:CheY-like chemotaxis protein
LLLSHPFPEMKLSTTLAAKVLLVGDNRDGLLVRRALLEEQGFQVKIARNGEEGLQLYESLHFDVVVTAYHMPRMSGMDLIDRLRKMDPQARVILVSGFVEPLGLTEENTGANAVIAKNSHESAHLVRSVKRLVNRAPSRKPPRAQTRLESTRMAQAR